MRDVVVCLEDPGYPAAQGLVVRAGQRDRCIPIGDVAALDATGIRVRRDDLPDDQFCRRDAVEYIHAQLDKPDLVYYVYVVDDPDNQRLLGVMSLRDLLLAEPDQRLSSFMRRDVKTVRAEDNAAEVARLMTEHNLLALPVTDSEGRMLGLDRGMKQAPIFYAVYLGVLMLSALFVLSPGMPLIGVMFISQMVNGLLLPIILVFVLVIINDRRQSAMLLACLRFTEDSGRPQLSDLALIAHPHPQRTA